MDKLVEDLVRVQVPSSDPRSSQQEDENGGRRRPAAVFDTSRSNNRNQKGSGRRLKSVVVKKPQAAAKAKEAAVAVKKEAPVKVATATKAKDAVVAKKQVAPEAVPGARYVPPPRRTPVIVEQQAPRPPPFPGLQVSREVLRELALFPWNTFASRPPPLDQRVAQMNYYRSQPPPPPPPPQDQRVLQMNLYRNQPPPPPPMQEPRLFPMNRFAAQPEEPMYGQPLPIHRFVLPDDKVPQFTAHKTLFTCMTTRDQTIRKKVPLPVISDHRLQTLDQLTGTSLKQGWQEIEKMMDYQPLRDLKAQALTLCIGSEAVFDFLHSWKRRGKAKSLPFVGFAGIFVSVMRMPLDVEGTVVVHTWIENGSHIRLMRGKERGDQGQGPDNENAASHHRHNLMRLLFQEEDEFPRHPGSEQKREKGQVRASKSTRAGLLPYSDSDDDSLYDTPPKEQVAENKNNEKKVYEREKYFKFSRVRFGDHVLIPMSEVNAVDGDGHDLKVLTRYDFVGNKRKRDEWLGRRYSEVWGHAALVQQTRILTAVRDRAATIVSTSVTDADTESMMQEMERMLAPDGVPSDPQVKRAKWEPRTMYDFLDRFLDSVQRELDAAPSGRVVSFFFKKNRTRDITPLVQPVYFSIGIKKVGGSIAAPKSSNARSVRPNGGGHFQRPFNFSAPTFKQA